MESPQMKESGVIQPKPLSSVDTSFKGRFKFELEDLLDNAITPLLDYARNEGYGRIRTALYVAVTAPPSLMIFGSMYIVALPLKIVDKISPLSGAYKR
jgi:hypothetical protein